MSLSQGISLSKYLMFFTLCCVLVTTFWRGPQQVSHLCYKESSVLGWSWVCSPRYSLFRCGCPEAAISRQREGAWQIVHTANKFARGAGEASKDETKRDGFIVCVLIALSSWELWLWRRNWWGDTIRCAPVGSHLLTGETCLPPVRTL